jgi:hypothetical protein
MKKAALALSVMIISGCASTLKYDSEYNYKSESGSEYKLSGVIEKHMTSGLLTTEVRNSLLLYINDELVIKGPLHRDDSGELQGVYNSKVVNLDCKKPSFFKQVECLVHIDKKRVGSMVFEFSTS